MLEDDLVSVPPGGASTLSPSTLVKPYTLSPDVPERTNGPTPCTVLKWHRVLGLSHRNLLTSAPEIAHWCAFLAQALGVPRVFGLRHLNLLVSAPVGKLLLAQTAADAVLEELLVRRDAVLLCGSPSGFRGGLSRQNQ